MDERNDAGTGLNDFPPIPQEGLAAVLAGWTGRGALYEALSVPLNEHEVRQWTSADVRMRANRVLLSRIEPLMSRWPKRVSQWLDHLPATKTHTRTTKPFPFSGVAWAESRRQFGWPPRAFVGKEAQRGADMLVVQVLRWCAEKLQQIWTESLRNYPELVFVPHPQLLAMLSLLETEPLASASPAMPARSDLVALRREGAPWGSVAEVAHQLMEAERSVDHLIYQILMPDEGIRWRLFHLSVLGILLIALRSAGCEIRSLRPLSPRSDGPNYEVVTRNGDRYSLWFEASSVWAHLGRPSPFIEATSGMKRARRSNGADLLLLAPDKRAMIMECKYSFNQDVVARDGYYQAMAYAVEARSRLAETILSLAVGPESVVSTSSFTSLDIGTVGTVAPSALAGLVKVFLDTTNPSRAVQ